MIVMFPMLVSTTVSSDTLPYICKVLEKFILLYRQDTISSRLSYFDKAGTLTGYAVTAAKLLASKKQDGPGELISEQLTSNAIVGGLKSGLKSAADVAQQIINIKPGGGQGGTKFEEPDRDGLALAPTYVQLQHPKLGTIILGVKVLPFPVSSEFNLMYYLSHDMSSNFIEAEMKSRFRKYSRMAWTILRAINLPLIGSPFRRTITGDPQKDIAYASTLFKHNVFCLINYNDSISEMTRNPGALRKMYKLGWNSLVFADDINRKATFCMQEFHGLCSSIPYSLMGASFGKEYQSVFQGMEEVKKSSASFFSTKKSSASLFSEHFTVDKYLDVIQGE